MILPPTTHRVPRAADADEEAAVHAAAGAFEHADDRVVGRVFDSPGLPVCSATMARLSARSSIHRVAGLTV